MDNYPRMVFRPGGSHQLNEGTCDYRIVADEAEHKAANAEGWTNKPPKPDAPAEQPREILTIKRGPGRPPKPKAA